MKFYKSYRILFLTISWFFASNTFAQDIIQKTNGAQINAKVVEIGEDTVWCKNKNMIGNPTMGIPRSDIKLINYWNGKTDYFHGSYMNLSEKDTSSMVTSFSAGIQSIIVDYIQFKVENLFTETHLILDMTNHQDSTFVVEKGKLEFGFPDKSEDFFVKLFPTGKKTVFAKFEFADGVKNKKYERLINYKLESLRLYMNDSVSFIPLTEDQSLELKEMFSSKEIR